MRDAGGLRIAYLAHTLRSDWNNGNAHFLRGLMRALQALGHEVLVLEPAQPWSLVNLADEARGAASLTQFAETYPELDVRTYTTAEAAGTDGCSLREQLECVEYVILHEWNEPALAQQLLALRPELGFRLLFHDTHHRASSTPAQMRLFGLDEFDGILAFGESLRTIYRKRFRLERVWTLHEAADVTHFHPLPPAAKTEEVVWIGNWGEGERAAEIHEFLLQPAARLSGSARFKIYGVRYPAEGLAALSAAGVPYGGYLPNLAAPTVYNAARVTVHVPRQQYSQAMQGIPTIRVFEALACGIPLVSAPWVDSEQLFRPGDLLWVRNADEMTHAIQSLLDDPGRAAEQAQRGLETVLARHTCGHRAQQLTGILTQLKERP